MYRIPLAAAVAMLQVNPGSALAAISMFRHERKSRIFHIRIVAFRGRSGTCHPGGCLGAGRAIRSRLAGRSAHTRHGLETETGLLDWDRPQQGIPK
jgi:hypothetical protein